MSKKKILIQGKSETIDIGDLTDREKAIYEAGKNVGDENARIGIVIILFIAFSLYYGIQYFYKP